MQLLTQDRKQSLSEEQRRYVDSSCIDKDSVLNACAGSGKSLSIIERMRSLAQRGLLTKQQMMIFSYSKFTIEHMKAKCKTYADAVVFSDDKLIKTIDAFCYDVLKKLAPIEECAV